MPFFDDSGPRPEDSAGSPLWHTFALVRDQLERMVALNLLWAAQGVPLLLAWAFPLPDALRVALSLYSALAFPPVTAALFGVLRQVSGGEPIGGALVRDCLRALWKPGLLVLMPLYSLFFWLALLANAAGERGWLLADALAQLCLLLLLLPALYWGPLLAAHPDWSPLHIARHTARLVWRDPARTLLLGALCAAALALGTISIAGMVMLVPVLVMLLQTEFYARVERTV